MSDEEAPPRLSDSIAFPLSNEMDRGIADVIGKLPPPTRWPAFNAVRHLNRAWKLRESDKEMAVFRSICAEEEAAAAVFQALKKHRYTGADKLHIRDHRHKNALVPFIDAISRVFARIRDRAPDTQYILDPKEERPRLLIRFNLLGPDGHPRWVYPQPPLNFALSLSSEGSLSASPDFSAEMREVASESNVSDVAKHLDMRANLRNRLLYAGSEGFPTVTGDIEEGLRKYQRNAFLLLKICLLIDPYPEKQAFVEQSVQAFLQILKSAPKTTPFQ